MGQKRETVHATTRVTPSPNHDKDCTLLGDGWEFSVGEFKFSRLDENALEVNFNFEAVLIHKEGNTIVHEGPSRHLAEYIEAEKKLEVILDVIAIQAGVCLRIQKHLTELSSATGTSHGLTRDRTVNFRDIDGLKHRATRILEGSTPKEELNALRLYRLSLDESDKPFEGIKIWNIFEQLFGKKEKPLLKSLQKQDEVQKVMNSIDALSELTDKQKTIIKSCLCQIDEKPLLDIMGERIRLKNQHGDLTIEEKKDLLDVARTLRSTGAHGNMTPKYDEEFLIELYEMRQIAHLFVSRVLKPKLFIYVVFRPEELQERAYKGHGELLEKTEDGHLYYQIDFGDYNYFKRMLPDLINPNGRVALISWNDVEIISRRKEETSRSAPSAEDYRTYEKLKASLNS